MMPRRFLNMVMMDMRVSGSYWVSRMKPEENLFYSSAKEAVAQVAQQHRTRATYKPTMDESTLQLPSPKFRFRSSRALDSTLAFLPFYGLGDDGGSRVVVADSAGGTLLYDADDGSAEILPPINEDDAKWASPISLCVTDPKNAVRPDALYAIDRGNSANFKSLVYCNAAEVMAWRWRALPDPPYFSSSGDLAITSHTLLADGKTICFSGSFGTYCFDTDTHEWTKAGTWTLPFDGRALRVPELYNLYFGFHESNPDNLIALELQSPFDDADAPPKVLLKWGGFCPAPREEWSLMESSLLYLGNYRFCIAKWFAIYEDSPFEGENLLDMAAVLTGVEIVNGQANKAKLQMVKHKTRTFIFEDHNLQSVL